MIDWFNCLGEPIWPENVAYGVIEARKMDVEEPPYAFDTIYKWVDNVALHIEADEPKKAIDLARDRLDLTGTYRLLGALCVGPHDGIPRKIGDECYICSRVFDHQEWDYRHLTGGASAGETWIYTCPNCDVETIEVGT